MASQDRLDHRYQESFLLQNGLLDINLSSNECLHQGHQQGLQCQLDHGNLHGQQQLHRPRKSFKETSSSKRTILHLGYIVIAQSQSDCMAGQHVCGQEPRKLQSAIQYPALSCAVTLGMTIVICLQHESPMLSSFQHDKQHRQQKQQHMSLHYVGRAYGPSSGTGPVGGDGVRWTGDA